MGRKNIKKKVQANEQLFRAVFDNAQIGISFFSINGREAFSNRACQEMFGCTEEELSSVENWDKLVHPDDRASGAARYAELQQGRRERDEWEQRYIRRDGRTVVANARFTLLRNPKGEPEYVTSLTEDITDRKRGEEALRENERLFRSMFENAPVGISLYKIADANYVTNRALHQMLGRTREELSSVQKWDEIVHPEERAQGAERYADLIRGKRNNDAWEQRFIHRDGRIVNADGRFSVVRDAAGEPQYLLNMTADITERKRAQEERNRIAKQMEMLLESTGQGIYGIDLKGRCTFINRAASELIGYRPEETLGQSMHDLAHHHKPDGSVYPADQCPVYRALEKGEGCRLATEVMWRRDGTPIPVEYCHQLLNLAESRDNIQRALSLYRETLPDDRRVLLDRYHLMDIALKVVGVGSVGTMCAIALIMAADDDPIFIQIKEAGPSVLEPYVGKSKYSNHGQRVVEGQRLMQSSSDIFLGWTHGKKGRHFYLRQLHDMKMKVLVEVFNPKTMIDYATLCGWTLARAHAKSGDAAMIAGYLGKGEAFDRAIERFSELYADQAERDHAQFMQAIRMGRIEAEVEH